LSYIPSFLPALGDLRRLSATDVFFKVQKYSAKKQKPLFEKEVSLTEYVKQTKPNSPLSYRGFSRISIKSDLIYVIHEFL